MVNEMAYGGTAIGFEQYDGDHASVRKVSNKIVFEEESRLAGLGVLIDSCIGFRFTGDGFVVAPEHRDLLDKADIPYRIA